MTLFLAALAMTGVAALFGILLARRPRTADFGVLALLFAGCATGIAAAVRVLVSGHSPSLRAAWNVPLASFSVGVDPLSAFFLLIVFTVSLPVIVYGAGYPEEGRGSQAPVGRVMLPVLIGSMALVVMARNGILFLAAWEAMAVSSFFLVTRNDAAVEVRNAGKSYLIASHLGTAFILAFFLLSARGAGTLDFDAFAGGASAATGGALFVLALVGFGTKAGLMPMHVWLPEAHPAAPSHVSALMSGVMIKIGVYGLIRFLPAIGPETGWWGWSVLTLGVVSGGLGGLSAIASHDFKRMMAYHSVENIGIIAIGIGVGLLGLHYGSLPIAVLGFAGALFHTFNHAFFKALLFLGAGAVVHATGTRALEHYGGLMKRMPYTAALFTLGAMAISGLPPLNGFLGEFVIYRAGLQGLSEAFAGAVLLVVSVVGGLAFISALSGGAFMKALGTVFLGNPRSTEAGHAHEGSFAMLAAMGGLAAVCVAVAFGAPWLMAWIAYPAAVPAGSDPGAARAVLVTATTSFKGVVAVFSILAGTAVVLSFLRRLLLSGRSVASAVTWDCGYSVPTARMQYTASSFVEPLTTLFAPVLRTSRRMVKPEGLFPRRASFESHTPDAVQEQAYHRTAVTVDRILLRFRWLQQGRVNLYVLYIVAALIALLVWQAALT